MNEIYIIAAFLVVVILVICIFLNTMRKQNRDILDKLNQSNQVQGLSDEKLILLFQQLEKRLQSLEMGNDQKMEFMRNTLRDQLQQIQEDNGRKLEQMRQTVDEKLAKTLEERMNHSFNLVGKRLEQVYHGLGEMRNLAEGVGDLKRVLSNVKTRGILGEVQLGSILKEVMAPEQYEENVAVIPGKPQVVEFAVKLPGEGESHVYLPIDSKFPADAYMTLQDAYDTGDRKVVEQAAAALTIRIRQFAKDISTKYIEPPYTTDFGVMFLPFEGLYAEVVNRGLVELLQKDYKITIAGPSTMAAMLNSMQMGFRTLAIQKRSSQVWELLSSVRTEFDKFEEVLNGTRQRLDQANKELDQLVGVRTRQIQRKLRDVEMKDI